MSLGRPWLAIGSLSAVAVGSVALTVASGIWMATSANDYNQTNYEVTAATAALDYSVATTGAVLFGTTALAAVGAVGVLLIDSEVLLGESTQEEATNR
ncbi:MAG: hypothetical protein GY822_31525 [Deltaproteobacteria bacterium]|nr:hypothetical protein [Deltaproteobacteria bacterium]